jgi:hypothetical protein
MDPAVFPTFRTCSSEAVTSKQLSVNFLNKSSACQVI